MRYFLPIFVLLSFLFSPLSANLVCQIYSITECLSCVPSYYLNTTTKSCVSCQDLLTGCLTCSSLIVSSVSKPSCTQCRDGYDRIVDTTNGSYCIACPEKMYYDTTSSKCTNCTIADCKRCALSDIPDAVFACKQCIDGYHLDQNHVCILNTVQFNFATANAALLGNQTLLMFVTENYLLTLLPIFKYPVNNLQTLSRVCRNNGFSCQCTSPSMSSRCTTISSTTAANYSQYIKNIYNNMSGLTLNLLNIKSYNLAIQSVLEDQAETVNILNKLNTAVGSLVAATDGLEYIRVIFEIIGKIKYTSTTYATLNGIIKALDLKVMEFLDSAYTSTFSTASGSIVVFGNQYVYKKSKYAGTTTIYSTANSTYGDLNATYSVVVTGHDYQLMLFNRSAYDQSFTGVLFYGNLFGQASNAVITIPYLSSLAAVGEYQMFNPVNPLTAVNSTISLSSGLFTFTYNNLDLNSSFVRSINSTTVNVIDYHSDIRIEHLFYRSAFFYILFFLLLYLIFIPLCTFYDIVKDNKSRRYKPYVIKQRGTMEDIRVPEQQIPAYEQQNQNNQINYKQFFPIYNIAATQNRPQRLLKLCLFFLNLQTPTTMLVILYVGVPKDPVWAILLAIPSYFLHIIFGYIYGSLKKCIRGRWKWVINVMVVVYWIVWFIVMPMLSANQFPLFVLIFSVVLVVIDIIVDALQCFAMYFIIKENNPIYDCIAPLLAYRGYFDYEKYNVGQ